MHIYTSLYSYISFVLSHFSLHQVFLVYLIAVVTMRFTYVMFITFIVTFTLVILVRHWPWCTLSEGPRLRKIIPPRIERIERTEHSSCMLLILFHIQSLSAFALRFIHWHAYSANMYAANYSNCTVLFGLYIKHSFIYQLRVMAVIRWYLRTQFPESLLTQQALCCSRWGR